MRKATFVGLAAAIFMMFPVVPAAALSGTFLTLSSQQGDPILNGAQLSFTPNDSNFSEYYDGSALSVNIGSTTNGFWQVNLAAPPATPLLPGTYTNAVRAAFRGPGQPGIDVFGNGNGCNQTSGSSPSIRRSMDPTTMFKHSMQRSLSSAMEPQHR
jgi:hypothetical protein